MKRNDPTVRPHSETERHNKSRRRLRRRNHKNSFLTSCNSSITMSTAMAVFVLLQSDRYFTSVNSSSSSSTRGGHTASRNFAQHSSSGGSRTEALPLFEPRVNAPYSKPYGHVPQHRVKVSKRMIEYDMNHPWFSSRQDKNHPSHPHSEHEKEREEFGRFFQNRKAEEFETYVNSEYLDVDLDNGNDTDSSINSNNNSSNSSISSYDESISHEDDTNDNHEISNDNQVNERQHLEPHQTHEKEEDIAMWVDSQIETSTDSSSSPFQPIRIRAALVFDQSSGYNFLSQSKRQQILNMIQPTLNTWSKALSVVRIPDGKNLTVDREQLYDGMSCGPGIDSGSPSVMVPERHMDVSVGIENVDLIVYLSVGFREEYIAEYLKEEVEPSNMPSVNHSVEPSVWPSVVPSDIPSIMPSDIPSVVPSERVTVDGTEKDTQMGIEFVNYTGPSSFFSHNEEEEEQGNNEDVAGLVGSNTTHSHNETKISTEPTSTKSPSISPTIYNSTQPSQSSLPSQAPTPSPSQPPTQSPTIPPKSCSGTYLASATYCSTDQFDRPIAGLLHLCIGEDFFNPGSSTMNQLTMLHELGHILGFNSHSLAHFRDKDTMEPLTKRVEGGDVPDVTVECAGVKEGRGKSSIPLPSENILKFGTKRNGVRVAQVVTPTVRQIARNRFDCPDLEGAELESAAFHFNTFMYHKTNGDEDGNENEDDNGSEGNIIMNDPNCIGDHWERRLFKNDIMNPIIDPAISKTLISPLTLAYFIDSGWYQVDSSRAYSADTWGRGAGCDFVNKPCIEKGKKVSTKNSKFFCSKRPDDNNGGVKFDGCTNDLLSKAVCDVTEFTKELPREYQYFNFEKMGGFDADLDYCPIYAGSTEGYCKSGVNLKKEDKSRGRYRLDDFGDSNSRCIPGVSEGQNIPLCLQSACNLDSKKLHLKVDGNWKECKETGDMLVSDWTTNHKDYVECPDISLACPTFHCPRDCLRNNDATSCDFKTGKCVCPAADMDASAIMVNRDRNNLNDCDVDIVPITEYEILQEYYVSNSGELEDDERDAFDHITRMFIKMSVGEVFSFVAYSLLVLVSFAIVTMYISKVVSQRGNIITFFPRWLSKLVSNSNEWRVDMIQWSLNRQSDDQGNKDKMVATVLHNMRVQNNAAGGIQPDFLQDTGTIDDHIETQHRQVFEIDSSAVSRNDQQTILRSQLPPLPGVGRILSIPGFTYVDDSIQMSNQDEVLTTLEGTAVAHSRTSCYSSQLDSCSVQSNWDSVCNSDVLEESHVRRRRFV